MTLRLPVPAPEVGMVARMKREGTPHAPLIVVLDVIKGEDYLVTFDARTWATQPRAAWPASRHVPIELSDWYRGVEEVIWRPGDPGLPEEVIRPGPRVGMHALIVESDRGFVPRIWKRPERQGLEEIVVSRLDLAPGWEGLWFRHVEVGRDRRERWMHMASWHRLLDRAWMPAAPEKRRRGLAGSPARTVVPERGMIARLRSRVGGDGAKIVVRVEGEDEDGAIEVEDHFDGVPGYLTIEQWDAELEAVLYDPLKGGWIADPGLELQDPKKGMLAVLVPSAAGLIPRIVKKDIEDERLRTIRVTEVHRVSPDEWDWHDEIDYQFVVTGRRGMLIHEDWDPHRLVERAWMPALTGRAPRVRGSSRGRSSSRG